MVKPHHLLPGEGQSSRSRPVSVHALYSSLPYESSSESRLPVALGTLKYCTRLSVVHSHGSLVTAGSPVGKSESYADTDTMAAAWRKKIVALIVRGVSLGEKMGDERGVDVWWYLREFCLFAELSDWYE